MRVSQVVLPLLRRFAGVAVMGITFGLFLGAFATMVLLKGRGLLVEMRFVSVFRRLSLEWSGFPIQLILRPVLVC